MKFESKWNKITVAFLLCISFALGYLVCDFLTEPEVIVELSGGKLYYDENGQENKADLEQNINTEEITQTDVAYVLDLNTATKEELMNLPSVGEKTADKIIEYRNNSPFKRTEEIMNIKGIGQKKYEDLKPYICVE